MRTEKSGWTAALLILQIAVGAMLAAMAHYVAFCQ